MTPGRGNRWAHNGGGKKKQRKSRKEEREMFQVPLNTDHRLTAEQLFRLDERKEKTGSKRDLRNVEDENKGKP